MKYLFVLILSLSITLAYTQTTTIVNGQTYNHVEYFENGNIKVLGTIKDSLKTGEWVYYKLDNSILAKGNYKDGFAFGKWTYKDYGHRRSFNWTWEDGLKPDTNLIIKNDKVIIKQKCMLKGGVLQFYINGRLIDEWIW